MLHVFLGNRQKQLGHRSNIYCIRHQNFFSDFTLILHIFSKYPNDLPCFQTMHYQVTSKESKFENFKLPYITLKFSLFLTLWPSILLQQSVLQMLLLFKNSFPWTPLMVYMEVRKVKWSKSIRAFSAHNQDPVNFVTTFC